MITESGLRILLHGDFFFDRLAASYQRAFEHLGHQVTRFDIRENHRHLAPWLRNRWLHRLTIRSGVLRAAGGSRWNSCLLHLASVERADLCLIMNGEFVTASTVRTLREMGVPTFVVYADNPFPPHPNNRPETLPTLLEADCCFVWSTVLAERLRAFGARRAEYLPFAWDPDVFPYVPDSEPPRYDVVFIGGWDTEREKLLDAIAGKYRTAIWGPAYWGTRTRRGGRARAAWQGRAAVGREAAEIIRSARIVLNPLRAQHHDYGIAHGVIMRTFEVPGAGGFLLSTHTHDAHTLLPEKVAGAYYNGPAECLYTIGYYLNRDSERRAIVEEAHARVAREHTYMNRAQVVLDVVAGLREKCARLSASQDYHNVQGSSAPAAY